MKSAEKWAMYALQNNEGEDLNFHSIIVLVDDVRTELLEALLDACADNASHATGKERQGIYIAMDTIQNFNKDPK